MYVYDIQGTQATVHFDTWQKHCAFKLTEAVTRLPKQPNGKAIDYRESQSDIP